MLPCKGLRLSASPHPTTTHTHTLSLFKLTRMPHTKHTPRAFLSPPDKFAIETDPSLKIPCYCGAPACFGTMN